MLFFSYDIVLIVYFLCYAVVNVQLRLIAAWWAKVDSNHRPKMA